MHPPFVSPHIVKVQYFAQYIRRSGRAAGILFREIINNSRFGNRIPRTYVCVPHAGDAMSVASMLRETLRLWENRIDIIEYSRALNNRNSALWLSDNSR